MKKIYKYATGSEVPEGAVYLSTISQTHEFVATPQKGERYERCWYVWHYFLVEVLNKSNP